MTTPPRNTSRGRRTVLLHQSSYDLASELPASFLLRRELPEYRIYSELH